MVPNAVATRQVATTERQPLVHALPVGASAALAGPSANVLAPAEGRDAVAATGTAAVTSLAPGVVVQVLVPVGLHGTTLGLSQPRLVVKLAADAVPVTAEGQPGVPSMGQAWPAFGPLAVPMGAVQPELRKTAFRADVPTGPTIERVVVVTREKRPCVTSTRLVVGPAIVPTTEVVFSDQLGFCRIFVVSLPLILTVISESFWRTSATSGEHSCYHRSSRTWCGCSCRTCSSGNSYGTSWGSSWASTGKRIGRCGS